MTQKQYATLMYIRRHILEYGYTPSQADIARHFGITPAAVYCRLKPLIKMGYVRKRRYAERSLEIIRLPGGVRA